jgi:RNA polymerase sigma factor for flagellar operon FliA
MMEWTPRTDQEGRLWRTYWRALARAQAVALVAGQPVHDDAVERSRRAEQRLVRCRNFIAEHYLHLVHREANRLADRLPAMVQVEDLVSEGLFGLMRAIGNYKPETAGGTRFTTYAPYCINSAMRDYLRAIDPTPRLMRQRSRKVAEARDRFYRTNGRMPTDQELGQHLNLKGEALKRWLRDAKLPSMSSLHAPRASLGDQRPTDHAALVPDTRAANPAREALRGTIKEWLLRRLNPSERLSVLLYYGEGMTMKEIGVTLDLSESRVSQMMTSIRARMKAMTAGHDDDLHLVR